MEGREEIRKVNKQKEVGIEREREKEKQHDNL